MRAVDGAVQCGATVLNETIIFHYPAIFSRNGQTCRLATFHNNDHMMMMMPAEDCSQVNDMQSFVESCLSIAFSMFRQP